MNLPTATWIDAFCVDGICVRTANAKEASSSEARLPALWGRFYAQILPTVSNTAGGRLPEICGVYFNYASDYTGDFDVLAGVKAAETDALGLQRVAIISGQYLVFDMHGKMPEAVIAGWARVWAYFEAPGVAWRRCYTTDFEQYLGPEHVAIHIAVVSATGD